MKTLFALFLFSLLMTPGSKLKAQGPKKAGTADQAAIMLSGGMFITDFSDVNDHIAIFGNTSGVNDAFITSGIHLLYPVGTKFYAWKGTFGYDAIIPQTVTAGDSMEFHFHGWQLTTSFFAKDILRRDAKAALEFAPGFEWGKMKMTQTSPIREFDYRNVVIAPFFRMEFRYIIKRVAIGMRALYRYDITSAQWKCLDAKNTSLGKTSSTGPAFQFFVGLGRAA